MDLFEQETNSKPAIKCQGHRQCLTLEIQKDYYGDIIKKSKGVKINFFSRIYFRASKNGCQAFTPPPPLLVAESPFFE